MSHHPSFRSTGPLLPLFRMSWNLKQRIIARAKRQSTKDNRQSKKTINKDNRQSKKTVNKGYR